MIRQRRSGKRRKLINSPTCSTTRIVECLEQRQLLTIASQGIFELYTDSDLSQPGLMGSYVDDSLRAVDEIDWRETQVIAGQRVDTELSYSTAEWGLLSEVGLTGGTNNNWDDFSVQWDGYVRIVRDGSTLHTGSGDGSRLWIDINQDGEFDSTGDELADNNWLGGQVFRNGPATVGLAAGIYKVRIQYEDGIGAHQFHLGGALPNRLADREPLFHLFTTEEGTEAGLSGTYIDSSLREKTEPDWRVSETVAGTRIDESINFHTHTFGDLATVGISQNASGDYDYFSVQWDGFVEIAANGTMLQTRSDSSSRFWIDVNRNGEFEDSSTELVDNKWGIGHSAAYGDTSIELAAGLYPIRIQYEEGFGPNLIELHAVPAESEVTTVLQLDLNAIIYPNHFSHASGSAPAEDVIEFNNRLESSFDQLSNQVRIASNGTIQLNTTSITTSTRNLTEDDFRTTTRSDGSTYVVPTDDILDTMQAEDFAASDFNFVYVMWGETDLDLVNAFHRGGDRSSAIATSHSTMSWQLINMLRSQLNAAGEPGLFLSTNVSNAENYPHILTTQAFHNGVLDQTGAAFYRNALTYHEDGQTLLDYRNLVGKAGTIIGEDPTAILNPAVQQRSGIYQAGDTDFDGDFDASDAFSAHLIQLGGTDAQVALSSGATELSANEIRTNVRVMKLHADVDGDQDFDASDTFLIQLVQLAGSDAQIDASKGSSELSATEIRDLVSALGRVGGATESVGNGSGMMAGRSVQSTVGGLSSLSVSPYTAPTVAKKTVATAMATETPASNGPTDTQLDASDSFFQSADFRNWLDVVSA